MLEKTIIFTKKHFSFIFFKQKLQSNIYFGEQLGHKHVETESNFHKKLLGHSKDSNKTLKIAPEQDLFKIYLIWSWHID